MIELLVARWGFAAMVTFAVAAGLVAATTVAIPADVPSIALRAVAVYRVEVGAAVFLGFYLATLAFALSLQNRGFTEIGTGGVRAQDLATTSERVVADDALMEVLADLAKEVNDLQVWRERSHIVD